MERVRLANEATGGLTEAELNKLSSHHAIWAARAARTEPIQHETIEPLIRDLYSAASLAAPAISIVSSPGVMAFAGIFAKHILRKKSQNPEYLIRLPDEVSFTCDDKCKLIVKEVIHTLSSIVTKASASGKELDVPNLTLWATYGAIDISIADALDQKTDADLRGHFALSTSRYGQRCDGGNERSIWKLKHDHPHAIPH